MSRTPGQALRAVRGATLALMLVHGLAVGAGLRLGFAYLRARRTGEARWLGLPREALLDVFWVYSVVVPLLLVASAWEFLSPWNL